MTNSREDTERAGVGGINELLRLAERCEKATRQDRLLDAEICFAVKPALQRGFPSLEKWLGTSHAGACPTYTYSVDDALMLVPEQYFVALNQYPTLWGCDVACGTRYCGKADTPALAVSAAALRARHALSVVDRTDEEPGKAVA